MTTVTDRGGQEDNGTPTSYDVGPSDFTPLENDIIIIGINDSELDSATTITGWSATWFLVGQQAQGPERFKCYAARMGASPGSDRPNVSYTTGSAYTAICFQLNGIDTSGTVLDKFVQAVTFNIYNATDPFTLTDLSAFAKSSNMSLNMVSLRANAVYTAQSGFTLAASNNGDGTTARNIAAFYQDSEQITQSIQESTTTFGGRSNLGIKIELDVAAAGGGTSPKGPFTHPFYGPFRGPIS